MRSLVTLRSFLSKGFQKSLFFPGYDKYSAAMGSGEDQLSTATEPGKQYVRLLIASAEVALPSVSLVSDSSARRN